MNSNSGCSEVNSEIVLEGICTKIIVGPSSTARRTSGVTTTSVNSVTDLTRYFTHGARGTQEDQREQQQQLPHKDLIFTRLPPMRTTTRILAPSLVRRKETNKNKLGDVTDETFLTNCKEKGSPERKVSDAVDHQSPTVPSKMTLASFVHGQSKVKGRSTSRNVVHSHYEGNVSERKTGFHGVGRIESGEYGGDLDTWNNEGTEQTSRHVTLEFLEGEGHSLNRKPKTTAQNATYYYNEKGEIVDVFESDDVYEYDEEEEEYECDKHKDIYDVRKRPVNDNRISHNRQRKADPDFSATKGRLPSRITKNCKTFDYDANPSSISPVSSTIPLPTSPFHSFEGSLLNNSNNGTDTFSPDPSMAPRNIPVNVVSTPNSMSASNLFPLGMYSLNNMSYVNPVSPPSALFAYPSPANDFLAKQLQPYYSYLNNPLASNMNTIPPNSFNNPLSPNVNTFLPNSLMPMHYYANLPNVPPAYSSYVGSPMTHPLVTNHVGALSNTLTNAPRDSFDTWALPQHSSVGSTDGTADILLSKDPLFNNAPVTPSSSLSSIRTKQDHSRLTHHGLSSGFIHLEDTPGDFMNLQNEQKQSCREKRHNQEVGNGTEMTTRRVDKNCRLRDAFTTMEDVDSASDKLPSPDKSSSFSHWSADTTAGYSRPLSNPTEIRQSVASCGPEVTVEPGMCDVVGDGFSSSTHEKPNLTDMGNFSSNVSPQTAQLPEIDYMCLESPVSGVFSNKEQLTDNYQRENILLHTSTMSKEVCHDHPFSSSEEYFRGPYDDSRFIQTRRTHSNVIENSDTKQTGDVRQSPLPLGMYDRRMDDLMKTTSHDNSTYSHDKKADNIDKDEAPLVVYKGNPRLLAAIQGSNSGSKETKRPPPTYPKPNQPLSVSPDLSRSVEDNISVISKSRSGVYTLNHPGYRRDHVIEEYGSESSPFIYYTGWGTYSNMTRPKHTAASSRLDQTSKTGRDRNTKSKKRNKKGNGTVRSYPDEYTRLDGIPSIVNTKRGAPGASKYSSLSRLFSKLHFGKKTSKQNGDRIPSNESVKSSDHNLLSPRPDHAHDKHFYSFRYSDCHYGSMSGGHRDRGEEHNFFMYNLDRWNTFTPDNSKSTAPSVQSCYTVL